MSQTAVVTKKTSIVQSNYLIENRQKLSLSATQLLYYITGMINKDDKDFKDYYVDIEKYAELWDISPNNIYYNLQQSAKELAFNGVFFEEKCSNGKLKTKIIPFISYYEYKQGEKVAVVRFDKALKDCYINLRENFTIYSLSQILSLKQTGASVNTLRTYEITKQYQTIGERKIYVSEYKKALGLIELDKMTGKVVKEKYKNTLTGLKNYVLNPAVEHINTATDINISYSISGRGAKALIKFLIKTKNENKQTIKQNYIPDEETTEYDKYLDDRLTDDEQLVMSVVPINVHSYDNYKLKAIYNLTSQFIVLGEDKQIKAINTIGRFTQGVWLPTKSKQVKSNNVYGYYYACYEAWLKNQFNPNDESSYKKQENLTRKPSYDLEQIKAEVMVNTEI